MHFFFSFFSYSPISILPTAVRIGRIPNKQKETEFADIQPYVIEAVKTSEADQSTMLEADPETQQLIDTVVRAHRDTAKFYVSPGCVSPV